MVTTSKPATASKIGSCGIDCGNCPRYQATVSGQAAELEKVKAFYVRIGLLDSGAPAASLGCDGCSRDARCAYPEVRACAIERKLENCGRCDDYPCAKISAVFGQKAAWLDAIKDRCTDQEYQSLRSAFFGRKSNLDRIARGRQT